ncbi:MAG TPA: hypothetical protein VMT76_13900 [Puia sp.]|nr:hypothetical protein [Puia sp.]
MKVNKERFFSLVSKFSAQNLLTSDEVMRINKIIKSDFAFREQMEIADSVHFHIHVADISRLPQQIIEKEKGRIVTRAEGYIKYSFEGGVNFIFSHIKAAESKNENDKDGKSYLDHIGIDIRTDNKAAYIIFQQIPVISSQHDYLFIRQGDGRNIVKCCNMQVKEKYWVYPDEKLNYEFAFGPLTPNPDGFGPDLRPANPHVTPEGNSSCCSSSQVVSGKKAAIFIN